MKAKLIFILLCLLSSVSNLNAQNDWKSIKPFISKLIIELDLIKEDVIEDESIYLEKAKAPSYYDIELIMMKVKSVVNQYSDVLIAMPWEKKDNFYACVILVIDKHLILQYFPEKNILEMGVMKKEKS
jgi:hypothetical protein